MKKITCVNDLPLKNDEKDDLNNSRYVDGIFQFLKNAETPITIGIQGTWGSGKTSLINMLQNKLQEDTDEPSLCIFINAWEHSLLQNSANKAEITLSILQGIIDDMNQVVNDSDYIPDDIKKELGTKSSFFDQAKSALVTLGWIGTKALLKSGANINLDNIERSKEEPLPSSAKLIRSLRLNLSSAIEKITNYTSNKKAPKKFICFVDDLDRVPPETAIEILDVIKNIFEIPNCIFILAIDYDVIVKGLEGKFGKKTDENEREFRQYFDKIIQIPFSMPTGGYEDKIDKLLESYFKTLGYIQEDTEVESVFSNIKKVILNTTNGIPRSVKRVINTVSLLQLISSHGSKKDENGQSHINLNELEIKLILISLHINFPEISKKLMEYPNFNEWKEADLIDSWDLKNLKVGDENNSIKYDLDWKKIVYLLCKKNDFLKNKIRQIIETIQCLNEALERESDKTISAKTVKLTDALDTIRVVLISEQLPEIDNSSVRSDQVTAFCKKLHQLLRDSKEILGINQNETYAKRKSGSDYRVYNISIQNNSSISELCFEWYKDDGSLYFCCHLKKPSKKIRQMKDKMESFATKEIGCNKNIYEFYYELDSFSMDAMRKTTENEYKDHVEECVKVFRKIEKFINKELKDFY